MSDTETRRRLAEHFRGKASASKEFVDNLHGVYMLAMCIECGQDAIGSLCSDCLATTAAALEESERLRAALEDALNCLTEGDSTMYLHPESPYHRIYTALEATESKGG